MSSKQGVKESPIHRKLNRQHLQSPNQNVTAPEDAMQNDLVPDLPPSGGYEFIVTTMDVFTCYLFA